MAPKPLRVAIIGGGPSGIVQLKVLSELHQRFDGIAPVDLRLFESYPKLGGIFFHHSYEDGELVSSKFLTSFSDFRPDPNFKPDFFDTPEYLRYLENYVSHFRLWPYINLSTKVKSVRRGTASEHMVTYEGPDGVVEEWECDAVVVCSGVHAEATIPTIPGVEKVPVVMHSQDFKTRAQFGKDKTVMILGSGETGADLAYLAVTADTKRVILCHRDGWLGAPKRNPAQRFLPWLFGSDAPSEPQIPVDVGQITLFDTMYVHPMVRDSMWIWNFYHALALPIGCWICGGSSRGTDQHIGGIYGERFHASRVFFNKAWQRIDNYVSAPWRPKRWSLGVRIRRFFFNTEKPPPSRVIDVAPFPSAIDDEGIAHFPDTGRPEAALIRQQVVRPDVIIYATGYRPTFPFLNRPDNAGHRRYPTNFEADVRQVWSSDDPSLGFIGFVRPGFGAIPPIAEMQSMLFATNLAGRIPNGSLKEDDSWHYRILHKPDQRVTYGVEHDSYTYQLAKDLDGAPSFTEVLRLAFTRRHGWRLPFVWAWGASFNTKFRMRGPWRFEGAADVLTGELWQTITRREGLFNNLNMSVIPMMYLGSINLFYYVYAKIWGTLAFLRLAPAVHIRNEPKRIMQELAQKRKMELEAEAEAEHPHLMANGTETVE